MRWSRSRTLALGGLAGGLLAFALTLLSAFGVPDRGLSGAEAADATIRSHTVAIGRARVAIRALPTGTCFTVQDEAGSAHACPSKLGPREIGVAITPTGIGGVAGENVPAVIVRLTRKGTVWATVKDGAFYATVPPGYRVRAVVKVLRDGSRTAIPV